jgi:hypothetical protein
MHSFFFIKKWDNHSNSINRWIWAGYYLDKIKRPNHQVIVAPNFKSADYLYSKIGLISKISEKDVLFLKSIGISIITKISIEPIVDVYKLISNNEQNFELLELMAQNRGLKQSLKKAPPVEL